MVKLIGSNNFARTKVYRNKKKWRPKPGIEHGRASTEYQKWRNAVLKRDQHTCQLCGSRIKLEAHHLKRWAEFPELRFDVDNGQTLCKRCHRGQRWT